MNNNEIKIQFSWTFKNAFILALPVLIVAGILWMAWYLVQVDSLRLVLSFILSVVIIYLIVYVLLSLIRSERIRNNFS